MSSQLKASSGNTYIVEPVPYRMIMDYVRWTAVANTKGETADMRERAYEKMSDIETAIIDVALSKEDQENLAGNPADAFEVVNQACLPTVDKKK